jgi:hypothetical protein
MAKSISYRLAEQRLAANTCKWENGKGDHVKWYCPCGEHIAVLTRGKLSPGVVADTIKKLACLPKGWLQ